MKEEKPIVIELYELWNQLKARFDIVSPQPKSFTLNKRVVPITSLDGVKLKVIDLSDDTQVNSGSASNTQTLIPPEGYIYEVVALKIIIPDPVGSTSGSHTLDIHISGVDQVLYCSSTSGTSIYYKMSEGWGGTSKKPAFPYSVTFLETIVLNHDIPLTFVYINGTDANQVGTRTIKVLVKEIPERVA